MAQKRISDFSAKPKQNKKRQSLELADQSYKEADLVLEPMPSGQPTSSSCNNSSKVTTTSAPDLGPGAGLIQAEPEAEAQVAQHSLWRQEFYEAVDLVRAKVKRRFDQDGMKTAALRENMLINAANKKQIVDIDSPHLPQQIHKHRLEIQLKMMGHLDSDSIETVKDLTTTIFKLHPQTRALFKEVENLIKLCLSLLISAASAERTFSALRRWKTWLRTTITQKRLTHLALMHVHGDILDSLDIDALMRDFISTNPERKATFRVLHAVKVRQ
ncbi:hypothetical protein G5714_015245 [Onychostoma macrolepis]|uniref:HAT C-terminal dimerisation domain-containing protein n=1 Tax=Onychostoma macrolepis TaxID=369639 RepID=A0A7J6CAC3_9TELE|nr:hypothetical protein G5714_015245 [Onychostoma macrolepis]